MRDLFSFLEMVNNYEMRKVAQYHNEKTKLYISTCAVNDSEANYETGIGHPEYNEGEIIVVDNYMTKEEAEKGHKKWVKKMTSHLPESLSDVSQCGVRSLLPETIVYKRKAVKNANE